MTPEFITGFGMEAIELTLLLASPMLGLGLIVGLSVSIFQAVTQIQEMTLTFIPKILAVMLALVVCFPWMMRIMLDFTTSVFVNFPNYVK